MRDPGRDPEESRAQSERDYRQEKEYYYRSLREHRYYRPEEDPYEEERLYRHRPEYGELPPRHYRPEDARRYDYYEDRRYRSVPGDRRRRGGAGKFFAALAAILLVLALAVFIIWINPSWRTAAFKAVIKSPAGPVIGGLFLGGNYNKYVKDKDYDRSSVRINSGVSIPKGNRTIALFGIDARAEEIGAGTQADTILVLSIDEEGSLKMASILRDTYLMSRNESGTEIISKANSAFFRGGPLAAVNMLNENLDLAITDYAVVNFWGMANIIDELGGIRLTVTEEERQEMNFHMHEMHVYFEMKDVPLEESGTDILINGDQATMFCRLRKIPFYSPADGITYTDDYGRTARQRYVMMALVSRIRELGILQLMSASNRLFAANSGQEKFIQSSMDIQELIRWFGLGYDLQIAGSESFPVKEHLYTAMLDSGDTVVADTLEENVTLLHAFLYGSEGYEPSEDLKALAERIREEVARQN